jgi:hypothetical protein
MVYVICRSLQTALGWETSEFLSDKYGDDAKNGEIISVIKETQELLRQTMRG